MEISPGKYKSPTMMSANLRNWGGTSCCLQSDRDQGRPKPSHPLMGSMIPDILLRATVDDHPERHPRSRSSPGDGNPRAKPEVRTALDQLLLLPLKTHALRHTAALLNPVVVPKHRLKLDKP